MKIKLIATDLDETLMRLDKSISDYTISIFRKCREHGIPVCFVTARSLNASRRAIRLIEPDYTVTCGGALCMYGNETITEDPLPQSTANEIISYCIKLSSVTGISAETVDGDYFVGNTPPQSGDYAHAVQYDFNNTLNCGVYKLVVRITDEIERHALIKRFPNVRIYNYINGPSCFIASKTATKLRGLEAVAKHAVVRLEDTAAFGDDIGDADYLAACGYGVAVENALDAAKQAARYISGSCSDDGVAHWLEENAL